MKFRLPLWVTIIPLIAGAGAWWWQWQSYAAGLRHEVAQALPAGATIHMAGFPYRLEAEVPEPRLSAGGAIGWRLNGSALAVHRVPWQRDRQVITVTRPRAGVSVPGVPALAARLQAPSALASLHMQGGHVARLSIVWENPRVQGSFLPGGLHGGTLETHFRETPAGADIVISGDGVRIGGSAAIGIELRAAIQAGAAGIAGWGHDGSADIAGFSIADAAGEVLRFHGRVHAVNGALRIAGSVETLCPATVRAAVKGEVAPPEKRARKLQTIAVGGMFPGNIELAPADPAKPLPATRGQEPDCPRLR